MGNSRPIIPQALVEVRRQGFFAPDQGIDSWFLRGGSGLGLRFDGTTDDARDDIGQPFREFLLVETASKRAGGFVGFDGDPMLGPDWASIDLRRGLDERQSGFAVAVLNGPRDGSGTAMMRQEGRMTIYRAALQKFDDRWRDDFFARGDDQNIRGFLLNASQRRRLFEIKTRPDRYSASSAQRNQVFTRIVWESRAVHRIGDHGYDVDAGAAKRRQGGIAHSRHGTQ